MFVGAMGNPVCFHQAKSTSQDRYSPKIGSHPPFLQGVAYSIQGSPKRDGGSSTPKPTDTQLRGLIFVLVPGLSCPLWVTLGQFGPLGFVRSTCHSSTDRRQGIDRRSKP